MPTDARFEDLLRELAPQVLGALVRRYGHFDAAEDAVQEALLAAAAAVAERRRAGQPAGWLITVAVAPADRPAAQRAGAPAAARMPSRPGAARRLPGAAGRRPTTSGPGRHSRPAVHVLPPGAVAASQVALTLRAVGGLTTAEIARAFLVPEATMAQRISRAKQTHQGIGHPVPAAPECEFPDRLAVVLHVLYLVFNEGYTATSGWSLQRTDLSQEAIRLTRSRPAVSAEGTARSLACLHSCC